MQIDTTKEKENEEEKIKLEFNEKKVEKSESNKKDEALAEKLKQFKILDLGRKETFGNTALHLASIKGNLDIIKLLV